MRFTSFTKNLGAKRAAIAVSIIIFAISALLVGEASLAQQQGDSRPRTAAATATPPENAQATPTPARQGGPGSRIAPQLGPPPPPPILKPKPTPTPDPNSAEIDEGSRLTINADLVTLHVRVIDRDNHTVNNIAKGDFKVFEDGVPQPIFSLTQEEVPISYGLAVDTSQSLRGQFTQVLDAAKIIVNSNKRGDETFLEQFIDSEKIETVQDFTPNRDALLDGIENLYMTGGQTAVIDGVYLAAEHVSGYRKGSDDDRRRRALIVITDGEDRHSYYTETQLSDRLREDDVQIFVIGFVNDLDTEKSLIRKSAREKAVSLLNKMANETGGRAFYPQSVAELPQIANEIVHDMRTQYVISYDPTNKTHDGTYRSIKVSVADAPGRDHRIALTRLGRTAGQSSTSVKPPNRTNPPANNNERQPTTRKNP